MNCVQHKGVGYNQDSRVVKTTFDGRDSVIPKGWDATTLWKKVRQRLLLFRPSF
jgi:hypothetical protein